MTKRAICAAAIDGVVDLGGQFTTSDIRDAIAASGHKVKNAKSIRAIASKELSDRVKAGTLRRVDRGVYEPIAKPSSIGRRADDPALAPALSAGKTNIDVLADDFVDIGIDLAKALPAQFAPGDSIDISIGLSEIFEGRTFTVEQAQRIIDMINQRTRSGGVDSTNQQAQQFEMAQRIQEEASERGESISFMDAWAQAGLVDSDNPHIEKSDYLKQLAAADVARLAHKPMMRASDGFVSFVNLEMVEDPVQREQAERLATAVYESAMRSFSDMFSVKNHDDPTPIVSDDTAIARIIEQENKSLLDERSQLIEQIKQLNAEGDALRYELSKTIPRCDRLEAYIRKQAADAAIKEALA